jgi:histone H3/H4
MNESDRKEALKWADELKALNELPSLERLLRRVATEQEQEPFGLYHQGATEEESDFFLYEHSGDVACKDCIKLYRDPPIRELNHAAIERIRKESGVDAWWDAGYEDREEFYEMIDKFARAIIAAARGKA